MPTIRPIIQSIIKHDVGFRSYRAGGFNPDIVYDYSVDYFSKGGVRVIHDDLMLHTATGGGTVTDSDGLLKHRAHNLFLNSATAVTQGVAVTSGADHTLAFKGTGSITYSGAAAGTLNGTGVNDLVAVEVATTTGTLTCTVTGSVTVCRVYRSDLGGMQNNPDATDDLTYVATAGAAVYKRRNNYTYNGTSWVGPKCLVEPAATNLLLRSAELDNASWNKGDQAAITADDAISPDGTSIADKLGDNSSGGTGVVQVLQPVTVANTTTYTLSVYAKADQISWITLRTLGFTTPTNGNSFFDLVNGVSGTVAAGHTASIINVGNGWFRCCISFTTDAVDTSGTIIFRASDGNNGGTVDLDGTSSIYIYGAQIEVGSVPSSYIPTAGATVTRALETLAIPAANLTSVVNTDAMSFAFDGLQNYADEGLSAQTVLTRWRVDANNSIIIDMDTDGTATGEFNFNQTAAGTLDTVASATDAYAPGVAVPFRVASRHTSGAINGAIDGTALTEDATPIALADLSAAGLQVAHTGSFELGSGRIWGVDITDAGLADATYATSGFTSDFTLDFVH